MEAETGKQKDSLLQILLKPDRINPICGSQQQTHRMALSSRIQQTTSRLSHLNEVNKNKAIYLSLLQVLCKTTSKSQTPKCDGCPPSQQIQCQRPLNCCHLFLTYGLILQNHQEKQQTHSKHLRL